MYSRYGGGGGEGKRAKREKQVLVLGHLGSFQVETVRK